MSAADQYYNDVSGLTSSALIRRTRNFVRVAGGRPGYAAITNVTGPNDAAAMLDMLVCHAQRHSMEEHWVPSCMQASR
jgi:hypothetical protein